MPPGPDSNGSKQYANELVMTWNKSRPGLLIRTLTIARWGGFRERRATRDLLQLWREGDEWAG